MKIVDTSDPPADGAAKAPERTAQVIRWSGITRHDLPVDRILDAAAAAELKCVVVLGYDPAGEEYFASSIADGADVLWLLERLKLKLLTTHVETNQV
jgi:hypothetical protein